MRVGRWAALVPLALLAACTAGPSTRPGIVVNDGVEQQAPVPGRATGPAPLPDLDTPDSATIRWTPCSEEITSTLPPTTAPTECARVIGVLDSPYLPGQGPLRFQVLKVGTGPVPIAVFNDIDGVPGTVYAARLAATLPPAFLTQVSLVGVDRRGTGTGDAVRCVPETTREAIVGIDPRELDVEAAVDQARTAGQQCSITLEAKLPALDTWRTAGDAESLRVALGVRHLHAIGHGEGSRVLSVFAERYPDRVGRMVLDGLPDPNPDAKVALEGVAQGADAAFGAFADDCTARGCELGNARAALSEVLDRAESDPLSTRDGVAISPGVVLRAVLAGLSDRQGWPALSRTLADLRSGNTAAVDAYITPVLSETEKRPATFDATLVTRCNDTKTRLSTEQLTGTTEDWNTRFPLFGALTAQWLAVCSPWPIPSQELPQPSAGTAPPIVVLGTATDPVTPLVGTDRAAQQLTTATLVTWQGAGHGALGTSACATEVTTSFITAGKVPRDGTVCPP